MHGRGQGERENRTLSKDRRDAQDTSHAGGRVNESREGSVTVCALHPERQWPGDSRLSEMRVFAGAWGPVLGRGLFPVAAGPGTMAPFQIQPARGMLTSLTALAQTSLWDPEIRPKIALWS